MAWTWEFTLDLSGKGAIHEEWSGRNNRNREKSDSQQYILGEQAGGVAWHALGSNKLQKTVNFRQHTMTLTIATSGAQCHLDVTFRLKPGFNDILLPRGGKENPPISPCPRRSNILHDHLTVGAFGRVLTVARQGGSVATRGSARSRRRLHEIKRL